MSQWGQPKIITGPDGEIEAAPLVAGDPFADINMLDVIVDLVVINARGNIIDLEAKAKKFYIGKTYGEWLK